MIKRLVVIAVGFAVAANGHHVLVLAARVWLARQARLEAQLACADGVLNED